MLCRNSAKETSNHVLRYAPCYSRSLLKPIYCKYWSCLSLINEKSIVFHYKMNKQLIYSESEVSFSLSLNLSSRVFKLPHESWSSHAQHSFHGQNCTLMLNMANCLNSYILHSSAIQVVLVLFYLEVEWVQRASCFVFFPSVIIWIQRRREVRCWCVPYACFHIELVEAALGLVSRGKSVYFTTVLYLSVGSPVYLRWNFKNINRIKNKTIKYNRIQESGNIFVK